MTVKDFVNKENEATIRIITANYAEYVIPHLTTGDLYTFYIPRNDMGTGTFHLCEKSILLMRWIRKCLEEGSMVKWMSVSKEAKTEAETSK